MNTILRRTLAATLLCSLTAFAERPAATGHAAPELLADPATAGVKYVASLPEAVRKGLEKDGFAMLQQKSSSENDGLLRAVIRFNRPRDEVFAIITQPKQQQDYLPHVAKSQPFGERTAEGEALDMEVKMLFTFKYRTQHWYYPEEHRMEWVLDPKGADSLSAQSGFFQLYALDEHTTIAEYGTKVAMRDGFFNFIRSLGERGGVAEALTAVRKHVHESKVQLAAQ